MSDTIQASRRSFLVGAALTLGAAAAEPASGEPRESSEAEQIHSYEYWAHRGAIKLYLYRKCAGVAPRGKSQRPILFLAHGSSVSSRPTFDLTVPSSDDYSFMDKFAQFGYDVWTMDFEGYGRSSPSLGNSNIADGAADLKAAAAVVEEETGQSRFHLYGESGGSLRAGMFAMNDPSRVRRLVLTAFTWTGKGSTTLQKRAEDGAYYRTHNTRPRDREMIRSIFTRDKPGTADTAVGDAMADEELKFGNTAPTGTYLDMTTKLPLVDPEKLTMPVQIIRGEYDGIASEQDILDFFKRLAVQDREFVILSGAAHLPALGRNRAQFFHVMRAFLDMPPRMDSSAQSGEQK